MWIASLTAFIELVFIRIDDVHLRIRSNESRHFGERFGRELVVVIEKGHELTFARPKAALDAALMFTFRSSLTTLTRGSPSRPVRSNASRSWSRRHLRCNAAIVRKPDDARMRGRLRERAQACCGRGDDADQRSVVKTSCLNSQPRERLVVELPVGRPPGIGGRLILQTLAADRIGCGTAESRPACEL